MKPVASYDSQYVHGQHKVETSVRMKQIVKNIPKKEELFTAPDKKHLMSLFYWTTIEHISWSLFFLPTMNDHIPWSMFLTWPWMTLFHGRYFDLTINDNISLSFLLTWPWMTTTWQHFSPWSVVVKSGSMSIVVSDCGHLVVDHGWSWSTTKDHHIVVIMKAGKGSSWSWFC